MTEVMKRDISCILDAHTHRPEHAHMAITNCLVDEVRLSEEGLFHSAGIHPWRLEKGETDGLWNRVETLCRAGEVVAVGETGLDKLTDVPMPEQLAVFRKHVELSERCGLPLIVHCVKAMSELLAVKKELCPRQPWIWHGFRGKPAQARQLLNHGFYLSFGEHYQEGAMLEVPDERLLLETDDSVVGIEELLRRAAKVRGVEQQQLSQVVGKNIRKLFFKG